MTGAERGGTSGRDETFEELRPLLFSIAYRILGSVTEAEDAVTELLYSLFEIPVSSYTDVETREVTVATYLGQKRRRTAALQNLAEVRAGQVGGNHAGLPFII